MVTRRARPGLSLAACPACRYLARVQLSIRERCQAQPQFMMNFPAPASAPFDRSACADPLRLAAAAYLARFKGSSREHTESDLRCFLAWCTGHGLDPLAARRPHLELYIRWMQEIRRFKPSTVSRRLQPRCPDGPPRRHPPPAPQRGSELSLPAACSDRAGTEPRRSFMRPIGRIRRAYRWY